MRGLTFFTLACFSLLSLPVQGANKTWNNSGTDFNTSGDWTGGLPGSADVATFTGAANTSFQPNVSSTITISALNFSSAASSGYVISATGTNALILNSTASTITAAAISNQSTSGTNTISSSIILGAASGSTQTFTTATGGTLVISGNISSTNNVALSAAGTGTTILSASNSFTGGLTFAGGAAGGVLGIGNDFALGSGTFTILAGAAGNAIQSIGGAHTIANVVNIAATSTNFTISGSNDLTFTGLITNSGTLGKTYTINNSGLTTFSGGLVLSSGTGATSNTFQGSGSVTFSSTISDSANTNGSNLAYNGAGVMTLSGSNTFRGNFTAGAGATARLQNNNALGASGGSNTIANGATIELLNDITINGETMAINGIGVGGNGALRNVSGANTLGGTITLQTASTIKSDAGTLTLSASNSITATNMGLTLDGSGNINVNGTITTGTGSLTKNGTGTATLSGTNTYSGVTTISGGVLSTGLLANINTASGIGKGSAAGSAADLVLDGGTLQYTGGTQTTNRSFTVTGNGGGIDASGSGPLTISGSMIASATSGTQTLTLSGSSTAANTLNTAIVNGAGSTTALTKSGAGKWVLTGTSTYTGNTTITGGTFALGSAGSIANSAKIIVGDSLAHNGARFDVSAVSGGFHVVTGQTLAGHGAVVGSVTVDSGAHLAPGNSVGTLTVGSLTLSGGSILDYEFNGGANDLTVVTGALALNTGTVGINLFQESGTSQFTTAGTYNLFQYGSLAGSVSNLSVLNTSGSNTYTFGTTTVSGTNYVTLTISGTSAATSTSYTLTASAGSTNILTGGTTRITSVVTNVGSGSADTLNYTGLGASSAAGGSVGGSTTNGGPLAQGASGTNAGQIFTGTQSGAVVVSPVGTGSNATAGGNATQTGTTSVTVNVFDPASLSGAQSGTGTVVALTALNQSGTFRASAKVTVDNGLSNNQGFTDVAVASGTQIDPGNSVTVASFDKTNRLNGKYTATKSLGYDNVTSSGSAITGGTGNTANVGLSVTVSGQTAGAGQTFDATLFSGQKYGTTTGSTSSGYGLTSNIAGDPHSGTTATLINGTASANTTVSMSFNTVPSAGAIHDTTFRTSDILSLGGIVATGTLGPDNSILTDKYVLQLSYDPTAAGAQYIGWYDAVQSQWVNAIAGNSTGGHYDGSGEFVGSYADYLATLTGPEQADLAFQLNAFGYDASTHTAWAVLDHNSEFAVIPEPSTWGMIFSGFGMLIGIQRLRRRRVGT